MRFTFQFFSLLLALSCFAQPSPINRRAVVLSGLASATNPITPSTIGGGLRYWWNFNDVTIGASVSNQWADRVQGNLSQQTVTADQPTNSTLGVRYNGSPQFTTNAPFTIGVGGGVNGNTGSVFIIMSPETPSGSFGAILQGTSTSWNGLFVNAGQYRFFGVDGNSFLCPFTSGTLTDVIITETNNSAQGDGVHTFAYTNGVLIGGITWPGNSGAGNRWADQFVFMADNAVTRANYEKGTIREVAFYSNVLNSVQISNLHYYRTNAYGGSP